MDLLDVVSIPMGVLVSIMTQFIKLANPPKWFIQVTVLVLAVLLAFLARYQAPWYEIVVEAISTAGIAFLAYETTIKKL
jgi:hypothetical protein